MQKGQRDKNFPYIATLCNYIFKKKGFLGFFRLFLFFIFSLQKKMEGYFCPFFA